MKARNIYITICVVLMTLASCHKEEVFYGPRNVQIRAYMQQHVQQTRAYVPLDASYESFTAGAIVEMGDKYTHTTMKWDGTALQSNIQLEEGSYWLYAYMPWNKNVTLVRQRLSIPDIQGFGNQDVLVAKAEKVEVGSGDAQVNVPIYMDHLMAKVTPRFYLDETYAEMRTIEIVKVEMLLPQASMYTAHVAYIPTSGTYSVSWSEQGKYDGMTVFDGSANPQQLPVEKSEAVALGGSYFCPSQQTTNLSIAVTYNVYDTAGELTRANARAENSILRLGKTLEAGKNYNLYIKVVPSYLYVLSDNDMESSFVILN